MTIMVFKAGDKYTVRGIKCDLARIELNELDAYLADGYVRDENELIEDELIQDAIKEKVAPTREEADTNGTGKLSSEEVRAAAKIAGIEDYDKKRIATLKKELGYDD